MNINKRRYRNGSLRHPFWNYGANALYFITICTKNRVCFFGEVKHNKMILSDIGKMAEKCWMEIPNHFPFVMLHDHVIMPNHVHGIIEIAKEVESEGSDHLEIEGAQDFAHPLGRSKKQDNLQSEEAQDFAPSLENLSNPISFSNSEMLNPFTPWYKPPSEKGWGYKHKNKFGPQSKNLASIIRGYKVGVTKYAKTLREDWGWQSRYHDSIIKNERYYKNVFHYIASNPRKWDEDKFHEM